MIAQAPPKPQVSTSSRIENIRPQWAEFLTAQEAEQLENKRIENRAHYSHLKDFIGWCYKLMMGGGERKIRAGEKELTFRDVCREEQYWGYSEASCYRIGLAYLESEWFYEEAKKGNLPRCKNLSSKITDSAFLELRSRVEDPELKIEILETAAEHFLNEYGRINDKSIREAITLVQQDYTDPIAKPKKKASSGTRVSKVEMELQEQIQKQRQLINELKEQIDFEKQEREKRREELKVLGKKLLKVETAINQAVKERDEYKQKCDQLKAQRENQLSQNEVPQTSKESDREGVLVTPISPFEEIVEEIEAKEIKKYYLPLSLQRLTLEKQQQGIEVSFTLTMNCEGQSFSMPVAESEEEEEEIVNQFSDRLNHVLPPVIVKALEEAREAGVEVECRADADGFWVSGGEEQGEQWFLNPAAAVTAIKEVMQM